MAANMQLQIADALRFLDTVKQRFVYNTPAQPHVYSMFLETLAEYKRGE
jgi:histone deacetylase complex regulatory component SIN3